MLNAFRYKNYAGIIGRGLLDTHWCYMPSVCKEIGFVKEVSLYMCACVCVRVCVCMCACVHGWVGVRMLPWSYEKHPHEMKAE